MPLSQAGLATWPSETLGLARRILAIANPSHTLRTSASQACIETSRLRARHASNSSSSARWLSRQGRDQFTRASKLSNLKSRAAFKLLEIDEKHRIFRRDQTVVDLGYAPGSWSQVAISRVRPGGKGPGRVVGIDVIPSQPPKGVSTIQGNFLDPNVQERVLEFVRDEAAGRPKASTKFARRDEEKDDLEADEEFADLEKPEQDDMKTPSSLLSEDEKEGRVVDVVLSDMNEAWPLESGTWLNSVSNPWRRMMNTSGNAFRDHAGSMDLCLAALSFSYVTLKTGGSFLCKFYQGSEDKDLEKRMKALFEKVYRIKPDSSRKESREAYILGLRRKTSATKDEILGNT